MNEYYMKNREKILAYAKNWNKNNPERRKIIERNRMEKHPNYFKDRYKTHKHEYIRNMTSYFDRLGKNNKLTMKQYSWALFRWSLMVKERDNYKCQTCPNKAEVAHHILYKSKYPGLSLNINNGVSLCKKCHKEVHILDRRK